MAKKTLTHKASLAMDGDRKSNFLSIYPMERRVAEKAKEWGGIPEGWAVIEEARHEIEVYRKYASYFGYAFFIMRRPVEQP